MPNIDTLAAVIRNMYNNPEARRQAQLTLIHWALKGDKEAALYAGRYDETKPCPCDGCRMSRLSGPEQRDYQVTGQNN